MIKLWLKAQDKEQLHELLSFLKTEEGEWKGGHYLQIVELGILRNNDAVYDESGEIITPPTAMSGYHANVICSQEIAGLIPDSLKIPEPNNPKVRWFE